MRIGVDVRELHSHPTGVGRYLAELLARWTRDAARREHELVFFHPTGMDVEFPWLGRDGARVEAVHVPGRSGTWWEQVPLPSAASRAKLDLFFSPAYSMPLRLALPRVVAIHDVSFAAHPEWYRWRERHRRILLAKASAHRAHAIITLSRFSRDEIVRCLSAPAGRIVVTPLAADRHPAFGDAPIASRAQREPLVLYVGTFMQRRHLPVLIDGFARAAARVPGARLELVGHDRTWPAQPVRALADATGLGDRIHIRSYVDDAALADLYARAAVFTFLSSYEGFGLTPLEAAIAGVPPVVLDTPVAREVLGDGAAYVTPDAATLAPVLERLLTAPADHADLLARARRQAASYSWDRTARTTFDLLLEAGRR